MKNWKLCLELKPTIREIKAELEDQEVQEAHQEEVCRIEVQEDQVDLVDQVEVREDTTKEVATHNK